MTEKIITANVDCDAGRRMGCDTFCCRLLVRLKPHEMEPSDGKTAAKGFVDKDLETGMCVNLDPETYYCRIWQSRPEVCREYSCNTDPLLQIVLRDGFTNIADVAKKAVTAYIPKETYQKIPEELPEGDVKSRSG